MTKITAETTIPIQNSKKAKDATLILEDGRVAIKLPAMLNVPAVDLTDLQTAVDELFAVAYPNPQLDPREAG